MRLLTKAVRSATFSESFNKEAFFLSGAVRPDMLAVPVSMKNGKVFEKGVVAVQILKGISGVHKQGKGFS